MGTLPAWKGPRAFTRDGHHRGLSGACDGHQPWRMRDDSPHLASPSPTDTGDLSDRDLWTSSHRLWHQAGHRARAPPPENPAEFAVSASAQACGDRMGGDTLQSHCPSAYGGVAWHSLLGPGPLFIISKLFIYFCGLSDPFPGQWGLDGQKQLAGDHALTFPHTTAG